MAHKIICIGRQFGSGGHEIAQKLANRLGMAFYDRNLIAMASERGGIRMSKLEPADERLTNPWLYEGLNEENQKTGHGLPASDALFQLQSQIITEAALKEDCVIVGRCGGYVLEQQQIHRLSLFVCAPFQFRVRRKMEQEQLTEKAAAALVRKQDKYRKAYYHYYTGGDWGTPDTYDLCVNSALLGIDATVDMLCTALNVLKPL